MPTYLPIEEFLRPASKPQVIIDVRSPSEFRQGHVSNATNVPLFDDGQRAEVGTLYRQECRQTSILRALEIVGPRMRGIAENVLRLPHEGTVFVHCWRGGMRSRSVAWLLEQVDLDVVVLLGGYKAFRKHVLDSFKQPLPLIVLSGLTGAGKTQQLHLLEQQSEQVVDLEFLANHRGSAFGNIGLGNQPSVEQFENDLIYNLSKMDRSRSIWIEDESRSIGSIRLPHHFFQQLRSAPALFMDVDRKVRHDLIAREYGEMPPEDLISAIRKITKRMGGQNVIAAVEAIEANRFGIAIEILLDYYDKTYLANKAKMRRDVFVDLHVDDPLSVDTTNRLIQMAGELKYSATS